MDFGDGDRNGEPAEQDVVGGCNCLLYAIVLAALTMVVGFELGLLLWAVRAP